MLKQTAVLFVFTELIKQLLSNAIRCNAVKGGKIRKGGQRFGHRCVGDYQQFRSSSTFHCSLSRQSSQLSVARHISSVRVDDGFLRCDIVTLRCLFTFRSHDIDCEYIQLAKLFSVVSVYGVYGECLWSLTMRLRDGLWIFAVIEVVCSTALVVSLPNFESQCETRCPLQVMPCHYIPPVD